MSCLFVNLQKQIAKNKMSFSKKNLFYCFDLLCFQALSKAIITVISVTNRLIFFVNPKVTDSLIVVAKGLIFLPARW